MIISRTPSFKDLNGRLIEESVASIEMLRLGKIQQCVLMRGKNKKNPILLFLHGGPGTAQIGFAPKFQRELEEHFVVVNWDQKGAGKSYASNIPVSSMNIDQFLLDLHELIEELLQRFKQEKLYLVGHSWGSVLGSLFISKYPELIHAYIGVGQVVNMERNEEISYEYTLHKANETNNKKALEQLMKIGNPPYKDQVDLFLQRKWLRKFGGSFHNMSLSKFILSSISFREYSFVDLVKYMANGERFSINNLWDELMEVNLIKQAHTFKVPVFYCVGRYDYQTPHELVVDYFNIVEAPKKELIWFENSAHAPNFEEPNKFYEVCMSVAQ
ncbi:alpha/beta hydrolase [Bacillus sp. SM2101]|uniref:alpha/beta fold hydrolase n=1 Tax=Bacillus sp. SM2101 TaxID=2805366 RepID=UPI001BDF705E|nr:alpha/beta hydrolase [Bacillus sp. SM2101]